MLIVGPLESRPSRARGSKRYRRARVADAAYVAPLAGAWIETPRGVPRRGRAGVAPLAGAWIETALPRSAAAASGGRAPRGRVDRNTLSNPSSSGRQTSRPSRARGSKLQVGDVERRQKASRPSRARGSKHDKDLPKYWKRSVAPLAGAWIETGTCASRRCSAWCRAPRGRVDRNQSWPVMHPTPGVAPLAGAWIETCTATCCRSSCPGRAPRGRVDRNITSNGAENGTVLVAPLAGAWIETSRTSHTIRDTSPVAPLAGAWIETCGCTSRAGTSPRRAPRGRVDRNPCGYIKRPGGTCRAPRGRVDRNAASRRCSRSPDRSRPSRARGSKQPQAENANMQIQVAPLAGAWIETTPSVQSAIQPACRAPRGRVDQWSDEVSTMPGLRLGVACSAHLTREALLQG